MTSVDIELQQELRSRAASVFFSSAFMSQAAAVVLAAILTLAAEAPTPTVGHLWLGAMLLISGIRIWLSCRFSSCSPAEQSAPQWTRLGTISAAGAGLAWAVGTVIFMWDAPVRQQFFVAFIIAGLVAGALPTLSPIPLAFRLFSGPAITAVFICSVLQAHSSLHWTLSVTAVLFQLVLLRSSGTFFKVMEQSIRLEVEQRTLAKELAVARDAALDSSRAKGNFLAAMSHEIRTPLNGVLGMAQLLLMPGVREDERREYTRTILNSGQTLLTLLNDILDLSKVEAGKITLESAAFSPRQLIEEAATLFMEPARSKDLHVEAAWVGPPDLRYRGDATRLRQMLSNLVSNAIKFTAQGFVRIEGRVGEVFEDGVVVEFAVTDSGIGVPAEKQALLFQPFTQADNTISRDFGGTGLGLSIVRSLAQRMGGDVGIRSEAGHGARVWFTVRVSQVDQTEDTRTRERLAIAELGGRAAVAAGSGIVLIVDDNLTNRRLIEAMLKKREVPYESLENGEEALNAVMTGTRPDLILMDCQMPVMDGYTATEKIREWETMYSRPRLPIVALTAGAYQEDRDRCIAAGMDDFLAKPLSLAELSSVLDRWRLQALGGAAVAS